VVPQPRSRNACRLSHVVGLACSPFAHHYSGNRGCFLFLWVLRCFTSPRFLHLPYVFRQGRWAITPTQVSPFGNPRIEVWLPTPRGLSQAPTSFFGSWCQGIHRVPLLTWQLQMMLASTVQFSRYGRSRPPVAHLGCGSTGPVRLADSRPFPQDPTACSARAPFPERRSVPARACLRRLASGVLADRARGPGRITSAPLTSSHLGTVARDVALDAEPPASRRPRQLLLRKEVIQPHLPVRLPCYDFVPIAGPTFDGSLPYGLGHRLRVLPTFVT
jgi:hypothetical protein